MDDEPYESHAALGCVVAQGLLQFRAAVAPAHSALVEAAKLADHESPTHRRLMSGLKELGAVLNHRILDLERFGRSMGPFAEPARPPAESLMAALARETRPING